RTHPRSPLFPYTTLFRSKLLEEEDTPEAFSRIENLRELVNAAMDSRDRGETLAEFLDHAALVSDADQYEASQQITLMTLHAAKGDRKSTRLNSSHVSISY